MDDITEGSETVTVMSNSQSHDNISAPEDNGAANANASAPYLDESILNQIFMRTPTESLYSELRYACKPWFDMITNNSFLHHNHQHICNQQPGLLAQYMIQYRQEQRYTKYKNSLTERELVEFNKRTSYPGLTNFFKFNEQGMIEERVDLTPYFKNLHIMSCCNGLLLVLCTLNDTLHVVNIITKQRLMLPPPPKTCHDPYHSACVLVFLPSSGDYKVILHTKSKYNGIEILTLPAVGGCITTPYNDLRWRFVKAPVKMDRPGQRPLAIDGHLYWAHPVRGPAAYIQNLLSFNATAERFYRTPNPEFDPSNHTDPLPVTFNRGGFLELGGRLALVSNRYYMFSEQNKVDIWILNKEEGARARFEWRKQSTLDIDNSIMRYSTEYHEGGGLMLSEEPMFSFSNGEVLVLSNQRINGLRIGAYDPLPAYNIKRNRFFKLEIASDLLDLEEFDGDLVDVSTRFLGSHVNSIVPFKSLINVI